MIMSCETLRVHRTQMEHLCSMSHGLLTNKQLNKADNMQPKTPRINITNDTILQNILHTLFIHAAEPHSTLVVHNKGSREHKMSASL